MLGLLLAGCATEVANYIPLTTTKYPPKPDNFPVEVLTNGLPSQSFIRVATLDVHCESQWFMDPTFQEKALPVLIRQARSAGCDAIVEIVEVKNPANWTFETKTRTYTATGIVYKKE